MRREATEGCLTLSRYNSCLDGRDSGCICTLGGTLGSNNISLANHIENHIQDTVLIYSRLQNDLESKSYSQT